MNYQTKRKKWSSNQHEARVEKLYGYGVENYGDFHGGYLNFGLWEKNGELISSYQDAALNLVRHVGKLAGLNRESCVLDVACGNGPQDIDLQRMYYCKRIDALDSTWPHVQSLERRIQNAGLERYVYPHHGTATDLQRFEPESFSHVLSIEGVAHFDTRQMFLNEAFDVLKPGGVIVLADYVLKRKPLSAIEDLICLIVPKLWHMPQANVVTTFEYQQSLERVGFKHIIMESAGDRVIPGYFQEHQKPETIAAMRNIRGYSGEFVGRIMDHAVYWAFKLGLYDYMFIRAERA